jgi:hypothetical protein
MGGSVGEEKPIADEKPLGDLAELAPGPNDTAEAVETAFKLPAIGAVSALHCWSHCLTCAAAVASWLLPVSLLTLSLLLSAQVTRATLLCLCKQARALRACLCLCRPALRTGAPTLPPGDAAWALPPAAARHTVTLRTTLRTYGYARKAGARPSMATVLQATSRGESRG